MAIAIAATAIQTNNVRRRNLEILEKSIRRVFEFITFFSLHNQFVFGWVETFLGIKVKKQLSH